MKYVLAVLFFVSLSAQVFSQEEQALSFRGFRGNKLVAFDADQFSNNKTQITSSLPDVKQVLVFPNPGYSSFLITCDADRLTGLFNEQGEQLLLIDLRAGDNQLDLSAFSPGVFYLRDLTQGKLLSKLLHTK